jgi:hypothetical protein
MMLLKFLDQDGLHYSVGDLHLSIFLWVVWGRYPVCDPEFLSNGLDTLRSELGPLDGNDISREYEMKKKFFIQEVGQCFFYSLWHRFLFNPFGHIIDAH